jgi:hypothetical protein
LEDIKRERERQRRCDALMLKVSPSSIKYPADKLNSLGTSVTLPLVREDGTRPAQVLFKSGDAGITLDTALNNVDELKLFLERYY